MLYHEATFLDEMKDLAKYTGHSTALEAAKIAQKAKVKKLILGHFSNRYSDYTEFEREARTIFENTFVPEILKPIKIG